MTWEQQLEACKAIGDVSLRMRKPGNWYVEHRGVNVKTGPVLEGRYGNGVGPMEAVLDHWSKLTALLTTEYIVLSPVGPNRRAVIWNGFMWQDVDEKA